ncbi:MAG: glutamate--tRNA ligase [Methanobacteriota archaeon]|nr:MAG: glutamate--tRNA ligase [Euryarchaeota archaeon]
MREAIYNHALRNALQHGKADAKAVLSKILAERPELRPKARDVLKEVEEVVEEVNRLSPEEIRERGAAFPRERAAKKEKTLEDLPLSERGAVKLRFAPNPSGPLHLGHARAAVLNDEYAKRYEGDLILRFEDTDPRRVDPEAYEMIREDLRWLDVDWSEEVLQSSRFDLYYRYADELLGMGAAYVCTCPPESFKRHRDAGKGCPCRDKKTGHEEFEKMFNEYREGEAVLRLKTDLSHRNLSMRDFPIMRIVERPHPIAGDRRVYPLMNLSVAVDDHELGLTHVLRGKDHILNTHKQTFIFDLFGWEKPQYIHYGLLKIEGVMLSTSETGQGIKDGRYTGWDDVRLGTLAALRRRGIQADAVRRTMVEVGAKPTDISFSWKNLYAMNKELIDPHAKRYSFVESPKTLTIRGCPEKVVKNPLHPVSDMGFREIRLPEGEVRLLIGKEDFSARAEGDVIRLMGAYNVRISSKDQSGMEGVFHSMELEEARRMKAPLINWVVAGEDVPVKVLSPEGERHGAAEKALLHAGKDEVVQFERYGFVRIEDKNGAVVAVFAHR